MEGLPVEEAPVGGDAVERELQDLCKLSRDRRDVAAEIRVEEAEKKYVESLVLLDAAKSVDAMGREDFRDILGRVEATELLCHLNLAACALNQKRYDDALESSRVVLSMDERNVKAMYRAGRALFATSNFGESARILKEAALQTRRRRLGQLKGMR